MPSLKLTAKAPEKWIIGRLVSFWDGLFSGTMLVLVSVILLSILLLLTFGIRVEVSTRRQGNAALFPDPQKHDDSSYW